MRKMGAQIMTNLLYNTVKHVLERHLEAMHVRDAAFSAGVSPQDVMIPRGHEVGGARRPRTRAQQRAHGFQGRARGERRMKVAGLRGRQQLDGHDGARIGGRKRGGGSGRAGQASPEKRSDA